MVYFSDWDPLNFAQESCAHTNGSDVIEVESFEDCKKKSEAYEYVRFLEKKDASGDYKCFRHHHGCFELHAVLEPGGASPGSTYKKFSVYYLDYCVKWYYDIFL